MIKVIAAQMHQRVLDRAMQVHGALGHVRRHAAGGDVAPGPLAADRRRPRRGAQDGDRPARAQPLQAARAGRSLSVDWPRAPSRNPADHGLSDEQRAFVDALRDFARARARSGRADGAGRAQRRRGAPHGASSAGTGSRSRRSTAARAAASSTPPCSSRRRRAGRSPIGRLRRHADRGRRAEPLRHRGAEARPLGRVAGRRHPGDRDVRARRRLRRGRAEDARAARGRRVGARRGQDVVLLRPQGEPHPDRVPHRRGRAPRGPVDDLRAARGRGHYHHADQDARRGGDQRAPPGRRARAGGRAARRRGRAAGSSSWPASTTSA